MDRSDALIIAGAMAVTAGLYLVYVPLALIFGGLVVSAFGFVLAGVPVKKNGLKIVREGDEPEGGG